ncbi:MAG: F-box protein [Parachlamydiales bacterium]|nr:F-box protein [Parachlamydiales bacterium]
MTAKIDNNKTVFVSKPIVSLKDLPADVIKEILKKMHPLHLCICLRVCKQWHCLGNDDVVWNTILKQRFPNLKTYDENHWNKHTNLNLKIDASLNVKKTTLKLTHFYEKIKPSNRVTVLKIPQGLTYQKIKTMTLKNFQFTERPNFQGEDEPINKSYWICLTENVLDWSPKLNTTAQKSMLLESHLRMPTLIEVAALSVLSQDGQMPFDNSKGAGFTHIENRFNSKLTIGTYGSKEITVLEVDNENVTFGSGAALDLQ